MVAKCHHKFQGIKIHLECRLTMSEVIAIGDVKRLVELWTPLEETFPLHVMFPGVILANPP